MLDEQRAQMLRRLEELGPDQVRYMMANAMLPPSWNLGMVEWLAEHDAAERKNREAYLADQAKVAASAERASWIAALSAIVAVVVGLLGIVVTLVHH